MLLSLTSRVHSFNFSSVRTSIKHFPSLNKSFLKFNSISTHGTRHAISFTYCSHSAIHSPQTPLFQTLTSNQQHQIQLYIDCLLQWNQNMNLTAVKQEIEVMERHVEDSLAIIHPIRSSYLSHGGNSIEKLNVVDVGSGAGLPGLVLAIANPGWKFTLLESMNKRCVFLEHVVDLIGLLNVQVVRDRAENVGQNLDFRENFDIAVARAVAELRVLAEYCLPLVRLGGLFVAAKGHDPEEEVTRAERAVTLMGASLFQTYFVESYSKYGQRTAIVYSKDSPTPKKYPRAPGTPSKLPL